LKQKTVLLNILYLIYLFIRRFFS